MRRRVIVVRGAGARLVVVFCYRSARAADALFPPSPLHASSRRRRIFTTQVTHARRASEPTCRATVALARLPSANSCRKRARANRKQAHRHRQAADDAHVKGREGRQAPPPPGRSTNERAPCHGSRRSSDLAPSLEISRVCCSSTSSATHGTCPGSECASTSQHALGAG